MTANGPIRHDDAREAARELVDTAVGFAVLGWQRAQVARRDLERSMRASGAPSISECVERAGAELRRRFDACAR